jgi:glycosyltransferase involved in cell wall biosynthesis
VGGEEKMVEEQADLLRRRGHAVHLYIEDNASFAKQSLLRKTIQALQLPFSLRHFFGLREAIRRTKPEVVHVHNVFPLLSPSVYFAAWMEKIPVVQSIHNYRFLCSNGLFLLPSGKNCERCATGNHWNAVLHGCYNQSRWRSLGMALTLTLHQKAKTFQNKISAFVAPSQFLKRKLIEGGFPEGKIFQFPPSLKPLSERRYEPDDRTVLYVGRLSREKGLLTMLRAAKELPDWNFVVVGDGPLKTRLENDIAAQSLTNVKLVGRREGRELHEHYQKASFLILPSECYENLPSVILEAWFYGLPVVVSRIGGMAEMVTENKNGYLFQPGDSASLVSLLRSLSTVRVQSMREGIQHYFHENFSADAHYDRLISVYAFATANRLIKQDVVPLAS